MYSIKDVSEKTGLSAHTLRYYEREGLLSGVERTSGGFRQYTDADLEALWLICCLKNTGMSLQEITRFVALTHEGDRTLKKRVEMLRTHRDDVIRRLEETQNYLEKVTWKLDHFSKQLRDYEQRQPDGGQSGASRVCPDDPADHGGTDDHDRADDVDEAERL